MRSRHGVETKAGESDDAGCATKDRLRAVQHLKAASERGGGWSRLRDEERKKGLRREALLRWSGASRDRDCSRLTSGAPAAARCCATSRDRPLVKCLNCMKNGFILVHITVTHGPKISQRDIVNFNKTKLLKLKV